jgi:hypothetical protein
LHSFFDCKYFNGFWCSRVDQAPKWEVQSNLSKWESKGPAIFSHLEYLDRFDCIVSLLPHLMKEYGMGMLRRRPHESEWESNPMIFRVRFQCRNGDCDENMR